MNTLKSVAELGGHIPLVSYFSADAAALPPPSVAFCSGAWLPVPLMEQSSSITESSGPFS